jgi:hypothetical protein
MRNVLIVGAGQSGLMLGLWLRARDYEVTIVTNRSAAEVAEGPILSTQVMFGPALELERTAGLDHWQDTAPQIRTLDFGLVDPAGHPMVTWSGRLAQAAQSVDQRTKFACWMREFADRGGHLEIGPLTVDAVEQRCRDGGFDLVVVAAAAALARLFPPERRDGAGPAEPRRTLSAIYLHEVEPADGHGEYVAVPGCGEIIAVPALTGDTVCHTMLVEAVPGGPWDHFGPLGDDPVAHVAAMVELSARYAPALYERCRHGVLTDPGARLLGAITPTLRHPVATLPSGQELVGIGDTVCRMDPLGAQGANTATRCAALFGVSVLARGAQPFDVDWMLSTADSCRQRFALPAVEWTELLLSPPAPVLEMIVAAAHDQVLADALTGAFAEPTAASVLTACRDSDAGGQERSDRW